MRSAKLKASLSFFFSKNFVRWCFAECLWKSTSLFCVNYFWSLEFNFLSCVRPTVLRCGLTNTITAALLSRPAREAISKDACATELATTNIRRRWTRGATIKGFLSHKQLRRREPCLGLREQTSARFGHVTGHALARALPGKKCCNMRAAARVIPPKQQLSSAAEHQHSNDSCWAQVLRLLRF